MKSPEHKTYFFVIYCLYCLVLSVQAQAASDNVDPIHLSYDNYWKNVAFGNTLKNVRENERRDLIGEIRTNNGFTPFIVSVEERHKSRPIWGILEACDHYASFLSKDAAGDKKYGRDNLRRLTSEVFNTVDEWEKWKERYRDFLNYSVEQERLVLKYREITGEDYWSRLAGYYHPTKIIQLGKIFKNIGPNGTIVIPIDKPFKDVHIDEEGTLTGIMRTTSRLVLFRISKEERLKLEGKTKGYVLALGYKTSEWERHLSHPGKHSKGEILYIKLWLKERTGMIFNTYEELHQWNQINRKKLKYSEKLNRLVVVEPE